MSKPVPAYNSLTPFYGAMADMGIAGSSIVDALPSPAVMVWPDGRVIAANENAKELVVEATEHDTLKIRPDLLPQVGTIAATGNSENWIIKIKKLRQSGVAAMSYSLTGISIPVVGEDTPVVLIYGADSTLEKNLRQALIESRAFFQDLATCSNDFTWSTDHRGVFTFINQRGVLGYRSDILHGKFAADYVADVISPEHVTAVFQAKEPVNEKEIWLRGADGEKYCFMMSALPIVNDQGMWAGARGVGRDVSELRARETELYRARRSEKLINTVLRIIRNEVDPEQMLATAAAAVIEALGMTSCWIFQRAPGKEFSSKSSSLLNIVPRSAIGLDDAPKSVVMRAIVERNLQCHDANVTVFKHDGWSFLAAKTHYGGEINGMLCFVRKIIVDEDSAEKKPNWSSFDHSMIKSVADQLSVIIAQAEIQEELKRLSQTDGLTGLMNRRAFLPEVLRRLSHHKRQNRKAALLFIDLDNFKGINDTDGHARGDEILRAVAELLNASSRSSDLSARFGGDEFVLWLEEADEAIATLKANDLMDGCQDIVAIAKGKMGDESRTPAQGKMEFQHLGMSIGIAIYDPETKEDLDHLVSRADQALYAVKENGKGGYRLAGNFMGLEPEASEQQPKGRGDSK